MMLSHSQTHKKAVICYFIVIISSISSTAVAQTTTNHFPASGNVGIGTVSPSTPLHITGNSNTTLTVQTTSSSGSSALSLLNSSGYSGLTIQNYSASFPVGGAYSRQNGVSLHTSSNIAASGGISIAARNSLGYITLHTGGDTERLRLTASGNLGLNTTSPKTILDLGNSGGNMLTLNPGTNTAPNYASNLHNDVILGSYMSGSHSQGFISTGYVQDANRKFHIGAASTNSFSSATFVPHFTVMSGGNVGIGTTSPSVKFEVNGGVNVGINSATTSGYGDRLSFVGASVNGDPLWLARYNNGANYSELRVNIGDDYGQSQDMFVVGTHHWNGGDWHPHLVVQASGKVGIGTADIDEALTVKGKIHTSEVRVDTDPRVFPDYVFEEDYELMSLRDTEAFIRANKHLPEVPSAEEVGESGINLKEMNLILLKKVEELTLHLIELKKENEIQDAQIKSLQRNEN